MATLKTYFFLLKAVCLFAYHYVRSSLLLLTILNKFSVMLVDQVDPIRKVVRINGRHVRLYENKSK